MNDDEFEKKLRALTDGLRRPDPTPAWKTDILARARREADAVTGSRTLPPRWLVLSWVAAWLAIMVLNFTTPQETTPRSAHDMAAAQPRPASDASPRAAARALLAFQQRMNLNLDFPQ